MFWNIGKLAIHPRKALSMMMKINIKIWEAGEGLVKWVRSLMCTKKVSPFRETQLLLEDLKKKKVECFVVTHICWHVDTQFVERRQVIISASCFNDPCSTLGFGSWSFEGEFLLTMYHHQNKSVLWLVPIFNYTPNKNIIMTRSSYFQSRYFTLSPQLHCFDNEREEAKL